MLSTDFLLSLKGKSGSEMMKSITASSPCHRLRQSQITYSGKERKGRK